jgi:hypothetical protein
MLTVSNLEERIEFLLGVAARSRRLSAQDGIRPVVVTVVGGLFVSDPFGLRLRTLVILGGIIEVAVAAGVEVGVATLASVARADPRPRRTAGDVPAFPARELHTAVTSDE